MAYLEPLGPPERPSIPYRRIERRSHRSLAAALAVTVMIICAGGLWMANKLGSRDGGADVPLLRADSDPVKVKPDNPGGMEIPNRDRSYVYDQGGTRSAPEHLMPPPEVPLPRPAPTSQPAAPPATVNSGIATMAPSAAAAEAVPAPSPAAPSPQPASAAPTAPGAPSETPAATTAAPARPPQTATLPPGSGKGYRLQIAAVKTPEAAKDEWERIRRQNSDILGGLGFISERVDLGDRGIFYRIQAGPLADPQEGERICTLLRQRNVGCILVRP
ncbi:MAG TPA: SPOR domain-containing protein [Stellaceae bacterium]|nr:SPOR domain-containing protein [Stellaceae bacterium]